MLSDEYWRALGDVFGVEMDDAVVVISAWRHQIDGFNSLHGTGKSKLLSHLIYLSEGMEDTSGGEFVLYDREQKEVVRVPPALGSSVAFLATDHSWHSILPVTAGERRSVSAHFFHSSADLSWFHRQLSES